MQNSNAVVAIAAAVTISTISICSAATVVGPLHVGEWGSVIAMGIFTAAGLIGAARITFSAAERSAAPVRDQVLIGSIDITRDLRKRISEEIQSIQTTIRKSSAYLNQASNHDPSIGPQEIYIFVRDNMIVEDKYFDYFEMNEFPPDDAFEEYSNKKAVALNFLHGKESFTDDDLKEFFDVFGAFIRSLQSVQADFRQIEIGLTDRLVSAYKVMHQRSRP